MSEKTIKKLEDYKKLRNYTDAALSRMLGVHGNYIRRWRKAGRIIGIYEKVVEEFLKKEKENGRF